MVARRMGKKASTSGEENDLWKEARGILEGVSSLHSWIKKQTLIPQPPKMRHIRQMIDDVSCHRSNIYIFSDNINCAPTLSIRHYVHINMAITNRKMKKKFLYV